MTSPSPFYRFNDLYDQVTTANINSYFQVMEDPLQSQRLKYAFESDKGLLGESQTENAVLCGKCISELHLSFLSFDAPE